MGSTFVIISTLLYFGASIGYIHSKDYGLALMFFCYGMANVGLLIATKGGL